MLPHPRRLIPAAFLCLLLACPALGQNSVRKPAQAPPMALQILDEEPEPELPAKPQGRAGQGKVKFTNKDTAKNRRDYDMGTGTGTLDIGRDETTGEDVMSATAPKKTQQKQPFEDQPIIVQPRIRR